MSVQCSSRSPSRERRKRRAGFFLTDSVVGFLLIGVLGLVLVVGVTTAAKAHRRIADSAAATVAAEQAMALLRDRQPVPQTLGETAVQVRPATGGQAVSGHRWVEVTTTRNGRTATLVGLVPEGATP
jgi:hypothetical protein